MLPNPTSTGRRALRLLASTLLLLAASAPALAIDEEDLLPVDQAFALDARATAPRPAAQWI